VRIALVVPVLPSASGLDAELERNWTSVEHARALARAGADAHLFLASDARSATTLEGGLVVHRVPVRSQRSLPIELTVAIKRINPELVHAFHFRYAPMLASLLGAGLAVFGEYNGGSPPATGWKSFVIGRALARCRALCFTAMEQAQPFKALAPFDVLETPEVSTRLPGPGDRSRAKERLGLDADPLILVVARIEPPKDPWCTLGAFARIRSERPRAKLLWIDRRGLDRPAIEEAIRSRGLEGITIREDLGASEMIDAYDAADVMLHTSRREICGHAYVEALSMGLPIAASDIPAFRRWHPTEGVRICPAGDADAFAKAAIELVDRPAPRAEARAYFERELTFDVIARRRLERYQRG
jgi:glycosyltransferase involved in cell wall biosynthesis